MAFFFYKSQTKDSKYMTTKKANTDIHPLSNRKKSKTVRKEKDPNYWYTKGQFYDETGDSEHAYQCYKKASAMGHLDATFNVGCCLDQGIGTKKDSLAAAKYWWESGSKGHVHSIFNLGKYYQSRKEYDKALECFRIAVERHNDPHSLFSIGYMVFYGLGVESSSTNGLRMIQKAGDMGYGHAKQQMKRLRTPFAMAWM